MKALPIKNERQKVSVSVEKKDSVTGEKLEGVIFGLYAAEDILSNQGEVLVEKDTLLEKKATDTKGTLTFDSDLPHGKYYVKEEVRKAGYLPNEEVWNVDATYENQNLAKIELNKEVENQPTETRITKTDATTGNELEGAKLQVIDKDGTVWKSGSVRRKNMSFTDCRKEVIPYMKNWLLMKMVMCLPAM